MDTQTTSNILGVFLTNERIDHMLGLWNRSTRPDETNKSSAWR